MSNPGLLALSESTDMFDFSPCIRRTRAGVTCSLDTRDSATAPLPPLGDEWLGKYLSFTLFILFPSLSSASLCHYFVATSRKGSSFLCCRSSLLYLMVMPARRL